MASQAHGWKAFIPLGRPPVWHTGAATRSGALSQIQVDAARRRALRQPGSSSAGNISRTRALTTLQTHLSTKLTGVTNASPVRFFSICRCRELRPRGRRQPAQPGTPRNPSRVRRERALAIKQFCVCAKARCCFRRWQESLGHSGLPQSIPVRFSEIPPCRR